MARTAEEEFRRPFVTGLSRAMRDLSVSIGKIARGDCTVLITGETGTGKELVARKIHGLSDRSKGPFVAVNMAAVADGLIESELFGHEKGAFTGATQTRVGAFEKAHGGSLLLDEVGDMPLLAQAKILRVLQERELNRVGGSRPIKVDVRVIAATNRDLEDAVRQKTFRLDLLHRLQVVVLEIPPLRERPEDIPLLVDHFLAKYSNPATIRVRSISKQALEVLVRYSFPGNVRELENIIQRALTFAGSDQIGIEDLPEGLANGSLPASGADAGAVLEDELLQALKSAVVLRKDGVVELWHPGVRSITVEQICRFLVDMGRREFSRAEFAGYLKEHGPGYATAGRHLKTLAMNAILIHNGKKANEVRFKLSGVFFANP
jgi:two-component system, NtrC family, response regulator HydG